MFRFESIDFLYLIFTIPLFVLVYFVFDKIRETKLNQFGMIFHLLSPKEINYGERA